MKNIKKRGNSKKSVNSFSEDFMIIQKALKLASFTEHNPRPVVEIDSEENIAYVNGSAEKIFPNLTVKNPYLADLKNIKKWLKENAGQTFDREIEVGRQWFRQFFYYIPEFDSILVYGTDTSDRKKVEDDLRDNEKRYEMLFEKMHYGYALQDIIYDARRKPVDYRFVILNDAFLQLVKVKKEVLIGKTVNELSQGQPKTEKTLKDRKAYDEVAVTGKPLFMESYDEKSKKYYKVYVYKPNDAQISLICRDITKEKIIDEEKNNFIAIMSHELRNPLTPIMANAQFINSILAEQDRPDPVIKESMEIIEKQVKIMVDLLNDILDVARLSHKKIQLEKKRINISDVVKNSVKASMPFINTKQQKISVYFDQNRMYAMADPTRMEQILINLINNASKYTQYRGHIEVYCALKGKDIEIIVKDNGSGMDRAKLSRIFELFNNEGQPFMGIGGLGIGLNIVKNLVSMHGGTLLVQSKGKNKGSEFIVTIPAMGNAGLPSDAKGSALKSVGKDRGAAGLRLLIVDDSKDIRNTISKILEQRGHITRVTSNGLAAIKIAKKFNPDVALIDIGLPDVNGYAVAKKIKKQYENLEKKITLIAFTGYGQKEDKRLAKEAGFNYHLTKPVDMHYLTKLIEDTVAPMATG